MEAFFIILLVLGGAVWAFIQIYKPKDSAPPIQQIVDDPLAEARRLLSSALDKCSQDHSSAAPTLLWLAATDGTISKQEARIIFRFCEQQGTTLPSGLSAALEYLNSGMAITAQGSESDVIENLSEIYKKPIPYRAAFIGAAHAICGSNKRISKVKQDFLDRANRLVESPA